MNVRLTRRVGFRYRTMVQSSNGRIKPDYVWVDGQEVRVSGGCYYLDWIEKGRRKRKSVGKSATQAFNQKLKKEAELRAVKQGVTVQSEEHRVRIMDSVTSYKEEVQLSKKPKTVSAYTTALDYFMQSCPKIWMEDLERIDLLKFTAFLKAKGMAPRSVRNNFANLMTFLKAQGRSGLALKNDWPRYVQETPEIYEKDDLDKFFSACSDSERLLFEFLLKTGFREQEAMYAKWRNVNFDRRTISMRWSPEHDWSPKAYKEREVPVPSDLISRLKTFRSSPAELIFHTGTGKPNYHMLEACKAVAKRAKLNADDWWLHKFRATFCTLHLRAGTDLATVQRWMGHVDLASTMRYLAAVRHEDARGRIETAFS